MALLPCSALATCHTSSTAPVGISPPRSPEGPRSSSSAEAPGAPAVQTDFPSHLTRLTGRFLSRGHGERFDAFIWVNEAGRSAALGEGQTGQGAVLVEEAVVTDVRGDRPAGLLVMQRLDTWRFTAVEPDGTVVKDERVTACARCHGEAADSVFPVAP